MNLRDAGMAKLSAGAALEVTFHLTVGDMHALWGAAAELAMTVPGMTCEDLVDTIGPREDPSIRECIALLTAPRAIAGCTLETFAVREIAPPNAGIMLDLPELYAAAH
jgi:hypothetical protein